MFVVFVSVVQSICFCFVVVFVVLKFDVCRVFVSVVSSVCFLFVVVSIHSVCFVCLCTLYFLLSTFMMQR